MKKQNKLNPKGITLKGVNILIGADYEWLINHAWNVKNV